MNSCLDRGGKPFDRINECLLISANPSNLIAGPWGAGKLILILLKIWDVFLVHFNSMCFQPIFEIL